MASNATRVRQRAQAVNRLVAAAESATTATGVDAVEIPTHHREPDYLQTLQIEAAADLLERIAEGAASAETTGAAATDADAPSPETDAAATDTPADAPERPTRRRTARKES